LNAQPPYVPARLFTRRSCLIGTDGATVAWPQGHPEAVPKPFHGALADFEPEFFVEWQVADDELLATEAREVNSL
jgi:hypothetical protein